jgi:hypothetical protein
MNLSAFFGVVSTVDFALLGLWWVSVQARPDLRKLKSNASRMAYLVSLQFIVPGTASLLSQVAPNLEIVWRVSCTVAGASGILAILFLVPALAADGELSVVRFLRFGALPLYVLIVFNAAIPGILPATSSLSQEQVEAILFCLVIFLGVQMAWAAAMSPPAAVTDPPEPQTVSRPGTGGSGPRGR